ncbi:DUF4179 domain-containing protein [Halobacillus trueperi]|uniref:DUF4179 domain-containing protein n=1 Tax=Halobacillus trueperi TaxID=156205 RepID=A0A3D8VL72_9BACI|nr:DUF4179 domain-containing protein [Halobacillus trueperi]RDY70033.1 DUF4179 domain-containing protein [Halobacillus trueperi]
MGDMFKETKQYYEKNYYDQNIHDHIKKSVNEEINNGRKKSIRTHNRKSYYLATAAALFIAVLIGTSFLSPSVSHVMADLPIIGSIFDSEEEKKKIPKKVNKNQKMLNEEEEIKGKLREMGHSIGLAFYLPYEEIFTVGIKIEKETFQKTHAELEQQVSKLVHSYGRENYEVEVFRYIEGTHIERASYDEWGDWPFDLGRKDDIITSYLEDETGTSEHLNTSIGTGSKNGPNIITVYADTSETDVEALKASLPEKLKTVNFGTYDINIKVLGE